jgi:hypothetical protein
MTTTQTEREKGKFSPRPSFSFPEGDPSSNGVERSCGSCLKYDTCLIWRIHQDAQKTVEQQIGEQPFDLLKTIGKGCNKYLSLGESIGR